LNMPVEQSSWLLPAAKGLWNHRSELRKSWANIASFIARSKAAIACTGLPGSGKSVLCDHLSGKAFTLNYRPPNRSTKVERGKMRAGGDKLIISVIPGQASPQRHQALDNLFHDKPVDGVIHVVSNGFIELREASAKKVLVGSPGLTDVAAFRDHQMKEELADLDQTCEVVRQAYNRSRKPSWMLVAVAKIDLYYPSLIQAESYYSQHESSNFSDRINELTRQVGSDHFTWSALPVCAWLDDFVWGDTTVPSNLKPHQRDHYLVAFAKALEELSERK
jgi:hypothetical protein